MLGRQALHGLQHRRIALYACRVVRQPRADNVEQLASAPFRVATLARERNLLAAGQRAHHCRRLIYFIVSILRSRSTIIVFHLVFSLLHFYSDLVLFPRVAGLQPPETESLWRL
jgi:hypothetical protein